MNVKDTFCIGKTMSCDFVTCVLYLRIPWIDSSNLNAILSVRVCHFANEDFKRDLQVYEYWSW